MPNPFPLALRVKTALLCLALLVSAAAATPSLSQQQESIQGQTSDNADAPQVSSSREVSNNISMQPEALRLARALGKRLKGHGESVSQSTGTLTVGRETQQVHITRRKTNAGASLEVTLMSGEGARLSRGTWREA